MVVPEKLIFNSNKGASAPCLNINTYSLLLSSVYALLLNIHVVRIGTRCSRLVDNHVAYGRLTTEYDFES
jgi:hypothetical protein